jgi:hypothetical protein
MSSSFILAVTPHQSKSYKKVDKRFHSDTDFHPLSSTISYTVLNDTHINVESWSIPVKDARFHWNNFIQSGSHIAS